MKRLKIIIQGLALTGISFFYFSCSKDTPGVAGNDEDLSNDAIVQVFNAAVRATANYVYVDNVPVSGAVVNFGGVFPATAYGFTVTPGSHSFIIRDTTPATTQTPLTFTQNVEAGKSYTVFTYDTITNVQQLTVENSISIPTDTTARLRYGNFIYSTTTAPGVDVYSFRRGTTTPVFTNVAPAAVTEFIPYAAGLTDTLYVYATGTTTPLITKTLVPSLVQTRSYTTVTGGSLLGTKSNSTFATY